MAFRWLIAGLVASLPLLAVRADTASVFVAHLSALVIFSVALASTLLEAGDRTWFAPDAGPISRALASAASVVIVVTGVVALVTLASSAALRFAPSTQFLQLISALDIAWATTALMIGVKWFRDRNTGVGAGVVLGVICVWSIWRYIDAVGFSDQGEWIVDSAALMRYVLPYDMVAAAMAVAAVVFGARRRQLTVQPSPQS